MFTLYALIHFILRNSESRIFPLGIIFFSSDGSKKLLIFMNFFMTTVLFSAQQVSTQSLPPFLPLGNFFSFILACL